MSTSVFSWPKGWTFHPYNLCIRQSGFKSLPTNNDWIRISSRIHSTWDLHIDFIKCPQDMLWRVSRCWTEYMKCDSPTEISETNVPNSYSTSLAVVSDLEKWSHKLVAGRDVQWTFQRLQLPNIRLEPWRCCCWQCYRLPAVEGGARFFVKPFIQLSEWNLLNWQVSMFVSKVSKLKDQRKCEL